MLPFTHEQFVAVFAAYNSAVWPAPLMAYLLGLAMVIALVRRNARMVALGLALMWAWTGIAYHALFFGRINPAAPAFGAAFVVEAVLLMIAAGVGRLEFGGTKRWRTAAGWSLIAYAAIVYPLAGAAAGMHYPAAPSFGIAPCPVVLFTWGILLLSRKSPWWLLPVPAAWSLIGGSAAILLDVPQDWPLLASAGCAALFFPRRQVRVA